MSLDRLAALHGLRPERVCLIKPSSLGDVIHALPVLTGLRELWPDAHLAWVVNRGLRGLLDGHPDLDEVIPFDRSALQASPSGVRVGRAVPPRPARQAVRPGDRLAGPTPIRGDGPWRLAHRSASAWPALAKGRGISTRTKIASPGPEIPRGRPPPRGPPNAFGRRRLAPEVPGRDQARDDEAWADEAMKGSPSVRWLAVNVGARWLTKRWPPGHFASVARRAVIERGAGLVLVGSPEDRPLVDALKGRPRADRGPRPLRPDDPAEAGGRRLEGRRLPVQRHRPAPPGRRDRLESPRSLHLHQPGQDRSLRAERPIGLELRLVRPELRQDLPEARMHVRTDAGSGLAGPGESARRGVPGGLRLIDGRGLILAIPDGPRHQSNHPDLEEDER